MSIEIEKCKKILPKKSEVLIVLLLVFAGYFTIIQARQIHYSFPFDSILLILILISFFVAWVIPVIYHQKNKEALFTITPKIAKWCLAIILIWLTVLSANALLDNHSFDLNETSVIKNINSSGKSDKISFSNGTFEYFLVIATLNLKEGQYVEITHHLGFLNIPYTTYDFK